ncbi:MAG TPA: amino acid ABC transporter permease [Micromonosporaceae bacterium]|nr:amino acid ABC transporter permease [Micromonosporaceae bacterium]
MSQPSVLYDAPGPRTRRMTAIVSVVTTLLLVAGAYLLVYRPLAEDGQFTMERWGPLIDPSNESFSLLWRRLGDGFAANFTAAAYAIVASLVAGTALAVLRIQLKELVHRRFTGLASPLSYLLRGLVWVLNVVSRFFLEVFRGVPVVITILFVWLGFPELGLSFRNVMWYLVIGLTIYNGVVIGEILRSGMEGLPFGQQEAARSIGLSPFQTTRLVLLPQSYRIMLPALISQLVVVLKDTSLGFIILYPEIMRTTTLAVQILDNPIQLYFVVGLIFVAVNFALSKLAEYVQHRLARSRRAPTAAATRTGAGGTELETEAVVGTTT